MKIKKLLLVLGVAAVATMAFVGCSTAETTEETTTEATVTESEESAETESAELEEVEVTEAIEETNSTDGVYRVEYAEADEQGLKTFLEVTVQEGAIVAVDFDEVNVSDDEADAALEQALLTATTSEEFEQMIEGQEEAETLKVFTEQLMAQIEQGNTDTIVINR